MSNQQQDEQSKTDTMQDREGVKEDFHRGSKEKGDLTDTHDQERTKVVTPEEMDDPTNIFAEPSNQEYMSYYVHQNEWTPTRPIRPIGAMSSNPGPAIVNLPPTVGEQRHDPTKTKAPAYKLGMKLPRTKGPGSGKSRAGPGPAAYNTQGLTNKGKENNKGPKIGTARRFQDQLETASPGPGAYNREASDRAVYSNPPSFSMTHGQRDKTRTVYSEMPGPNAYFLPTAFGPGKTPIVTGPSFSIGKSNRDWSGGSTQGLQSPGPGAYMLPPNDIHMNKAPGFHMGTKARPPSRASSSTGPLHGIHLVKFDKYSTPRITFGIRHSPYKVLPGFAAEK